MAILDLRVGPLSALRPVPLAAAAAAPPPPLPPPRRRQSRDMSRHPPRTREENESRELTHLMRHFFEGAPKTLGEVEAMVAAHGQRWPCLAARLRTSGGGAVCFGEVARQGFSYGRRGCRFQWTPCGRLQAADGPTQPEHERRGRVGPEEEAPSAPPAGVQPRGWILTAGLRRSAVRELRDVAESYRPLGQRHEDLLRAELCGQGWDADGALVFDARHLSDRFRSVDSCHCGLHPPVMENILDAHRARLLEDLRRLVAAHESGRNIAVVCKSGKHRAPAVGAMLAWAAEARGPPVKVLFHAGAPGWACDCCWRNPRAVSGPVAEALAPLVET